MVWWIVVSVLLFAVVLLVSALTAVAGRARPLRRAVRRLNIRMEQAQRLQRRAAGLQEKIASVREKAGQAGELVEQIRTPKRG